ncbi:Gfo/Idh/MocA family oxidoreductase [bacterium]|nr:Gfo/Idh/MocA family oxidoreductase [bacterium]
MSIPGLSRRRFMQTAVAAGAAAHTLTVLGATPKGAGRTIKAGLIGCGGRGKGAIRQHVDAGKALGANVQVHAMADYFRARALKAGKPLGVPAARCFGGANGYKELVDSGVDTVLMATPPLFRPAHIAACIEAGKHIFIEKPIAVDPPGCRKVLALGEKAKAKGLVVVAGTNMRHEQRCLDTHQAVAVEGQLGTLYGGRICFCMRHMFWNRPIQPKNGDDLVRTWQNWIELSGDHLVEQHVHNIDMANFFVGRPPASAVGFGGRARRAAGNMYDFFSVDFDYGQGVHIHSMCRQVNDCWNWVGHDFVYEKGHTTGFDKPTPKQSRVPADLPQHKAGHYQEHRNMLHAILHETGLNQARPVAEATAAAIMGREAAYTGKQILWAEMMDDPKKNPKLHGLTLRPTAEDFEKGSVAVPQEGKLPVPGSKA